MASERFWPVAKGRAALISWFASSRSDYHKRTGLALLSRQFVFANTSVTDTKETLHAAPTV